MKQNTYYHVLYVSPRASDDDVKKAWRAQAARWHPDRHPHSRAQAQRMFILVNRAYTILKTRPQREAYNRYLLKKSLLSRTSPGYTLPRGKRTGVRGRRIAGALREILWPFAMNAEAFRG